MHRAIRKVSKQLLWTSAKYRSITNCSKQISFQNHNPKSTVLSGQLSIPPKHQRQSRPTNIGAYKNEDFNHVSPESNYLHKKMHTANKWQCIEYVRRWLLVNKMCIFPLITNADDMWRNLSYVERVTDNRRFPLKKCSNGSSHKPRIGALLIYAPNETSPNGHVVIICDVGPNYVRVAEQSYFEHGWRNDFGRKIPLVIDNGCYTIKDENEIHGWVEIDDSDQLKSINEAQCHERLHELKKKNLLGKLERRSITDKSFHSINNWLDEQDLAENYFIKLYGINLIRADTDTLPYYAVDEDLAVSINHVSNELHTMFMNATEHVLKNDTILEHFCIPKVFWSKIRQSWLHEKDHTMTGRLDIAYDGFQLKTFEYNADSASTLFEMAIIQEKWAKAVKVKHMFMSAYQLHRALVIYWRKMCSNLNVKFVHLLIDNDRDEIVTALYMQRVLKDADIKSKLCIMYDNLFWQDEKIIDNDGNEVKLVWKTWMWETTFTDYVRAEKDGSLNKKTNGEHPRLCQILLNDHVKVIEPLWKVIPSNKAILPVLWSMFPDHPHLLRTQLTLTNDLKRTGYVKKPIVGRCGFNLTMYDRGGESILDETQGDFNDRDAIYQQLFALPKYQDYYAVIGSWIIYGTFAGFGIREDKKLVTDAESPVTACCIVSK